MVGAYNKVLPFVQHKLVEPEPSSVWTYEVKKFWDDKTCLLSTLLFWDGGGGRSAALWHVPPFEAFWDLRVYFLCVRRHLFWCASMRAEWSARARQLADVHLERKSGGNHQFGGRICHFCFPKYAREFVLSLFLRVQEQTKTCGSSCNAEQVLLFFFFFLFLLACISFSFLLCVFACAPLSCLTWLTAGRSVVSSRAGELSRLCPLLNIYRCTREEEEEEEENQIFLFTLPDFCPLNTADLLSDFFFNPHLWHESEILRRDFLPSLHRQSSSLGFSPVCVRITVPTLCLFVV